MEWMWRRTFEARLLVKPTGDTSELGPVKVLRNLVRRVLAGLIPGPSMMSVDGNNNLKSNKVLSEQEFAVFTLCSIFDAHYLPWFKRCYSSTHRATFDNRLNSLVNNLQLMFARHTHRKQVLLDLAMRRAFRLKRKLQLTIESVDSGYLEQYPIKIGIAFRSTGQLVSSTYNLGTEIPIQANYELQIDIPLELNDTDTRVEINFYFAQSAEQFYTVKECDISGYAGYSHDFAISDYGQNLGFRLNLRWELDPVAIFAQIEEPNIIVDHFSGALLAAGTYYFRFYLGLFSQLLLNKSTQFKALQTFHEVAFVTGSFNRSKLCPTIMTLMLDQKEQSQEAECKSCPRTFHLFHAALLLLNTVNATQQTSLLRRLLSIPFAHLMRFECWTVRKDTNLPLHRLLIRRLYQIMQKCDEVRHDVNESMLGQITFRLMVDASRKSELEPLLNESVLLFVKYFKLFKGGQGVSADGGETAREGKLGFGDNLSSSSETTTGAYQLEDSDSDYDLLGRILTDHFAEMVSEERLYGSEYLEPTANLMARLTKEFRRHQLFAPPTIPVDYSPPEREVTITLTSSSAV